MKHRVGRSEDFESAMTLTEVAGRSLGIVRSGGELYAVLNVCPHELAPICEGPVVGTMLPSEQGSACFGLTGRVLRCPWHGYEFDLANGGRALFTSFRGRVRTFPVSIVDDDVYVEMKGA